MKKNKGKHYFQLNLDVSGRRCLIVGGDDEAIEKTERLLECEADITLVSRKVLPEIQAFADGGKIKLILRNYSAGDEDGMYFVLNCVKTDPPMSQTLFDNCVQKAILISSYDQPQFSTATMSALLRAGKMRIAISSNDASPAMARILRIELEKMLDEEFSKFVDWVAEYREKLVENGMPPAERKKHLRVFLEDFRIEGKCLYPERFRKGLPPEKI